MQLYKLISDECAFAGPRNSFGNPKTLSLSRYSGRGRGVRVFGARYGWPSPQPSPRVLGEGEGTLPPILSRTRFAVLALLASFAVDCAAEPAHPANERLEIAGGVIDLQITQGKWRVTHADLLAWVQSGAKAVSNYYGKYPVKHLTLTIKTDGEGDEIHGVTYDGRLINMTIGAKTTSADLRDDWTMTHEMFHLAFPDMGENHLWMNEGLSVYLEPVARARIGILSPEEYWKELVEGLPKGLPESGDRGLDRTHTWGRTYWGGSLFWFLADLRIREETQNRKSLDDATRAILAAGGDGSQEWSVDKMARMCDQVTGTQVVTKLYAEMATAPVTVDLGAIWRRLGVRYRDGVVTFDDKAPSASIRQGMIARAGG